MFSSSNYFCHVVIKIRKIILLLAACLMFFTTSMEEMERCYSFVVSRTPHKTITKILGIEKIYHLHLIAGVVDSETWLLQGVLVVTRHGDRGPLTHLRGGDKLPCDTQPVSPLLKR
jgi:hypothetical protein